MPDNSPSFTLGLLSSHDDWKQYITYIVVASNPITMEFKKAAIATRVFSFSRRSIELLETILRNLVISLTAILTTIVVANVIMRYVFSNSMIWVNELARYLAIWITFLYIGILVKEDNHLQVEILFQRWNLRIRTYIRTVQLGLNLTLGVLVTYYGYQYVTLAGPLSTSPTLDIEMYWIYLALPIGGILMVVFTVHKLIMLIIRPEILDQDYNSRFTMEED